MDDDVVEDESVDDGLDKFWYEMVSQQQETEKKREAKNYLYAGLIILGIILLYFCTRVEGYERGDRVKVIETTLAVAKYEYDEGLVHAANHEDQITVLEYLNDGKAKVIDAGTQGKFIYRMGGMMEIKFDGDLRNWWVPAKTVVKISK